jgi:anaerobic selenocysteine-containing dehydrogenase
MEITRRQFLIGTGVAATGAAIPGIQADAASVDVPELRTKGLQKTTTICPFCAVGCGAVVHVKDGRIVNIEGDEASPINQGSLCSKGQALFQVANNERRLQKVMYRAPGSGQWEEKSWEWALDRIAVLMKETRDRTFVARETSKNDGHAYLVNRTEGMAILGGAGLDNEECYLESKFARSMGIVYLEHQARL